MSLKFLRTAQAIRVQDLASSAGQARKIRSCEKSDTDLRLASHQDASSRKPQVPFLTTFYPQRGLHWPRSGSASRLDFVLGDRDPFTSIRTRMKMPREGEEARGLAERTEPYIRNSVITFPLSERFLNVFNLRSIFRSLGLFLNK